MNFTTKLLGSTLLSAITFTAAAQAQELSRIATLPAGAEVTGLMVNGVGEVFMNAQHVGGSNYMTEGGQPATLGYFDGFNTTTYSAGNTAIPPEGQRGEVSAAGADYITLARAGDALGDSIYEAHLFVRGSVKSLGADCIEKEMRPEHLEILRDLIERSGVEARPEEFTRYGSARKLYNFDIDNAY